MNNLPIFALKLSKEACWMWLRHSVRSFIKIICFWGTVGRWKSAYFSVMKYFAIIILTRSVPHFNCSIMEKTMMTTTKVGTLDRELHLLPIRSVGGAQDPIVPLKKTQNGREAITHCWDQEMFPRGEVRIKNKLLNV